MGLELMSILSFLGVAIILTLMPGPDNLFVLAQSISLGRNAGIATALGICSGLLVHIAAATLGISAVIYQSALAFAIVKYVGAGYLLFLAWKSLRAKESGFSINSVHSLNYKSLFKKGLFMNLLNPKVSLIFLALLPQFVNTSTGHIPLQMFLLGITFLLQAVFIFIAITIFSDRVRVFLLKSPRISQKINLIQGSVLGIIGLKIAFTEK
ncbi:Homoserine/homoserine lactone efflux protein [compost metagenome]